MLPENKRVVISVAGLSVYTDKPASFQEILTNQITLH